MSVDKPGRANPIRLLALSLSSPYGQFATPPTISISRNTSVKSTAPSELRSQFASGQGVTPPTTSIRVNTSVKSTAPSWLMSGSQTGVAVPPSMNGRSCATSEDVDGLPMSNAAYQPSGELPNAGCSCKAFQPAEVRTPSSVAGGAQAPPSGSEHTTCQSSHATPGFNWSPDTFSVSCHTRREVSGGIGAGVATALKMR